MPAANTIAWLDRRSENLPVLTSRMYAAVKLNNPHNAFTVADDNPSAGGDANGVCSG